MSTRGSIGTTASALSLADLSVAAGINGPTTNVSNGDGFDIEGLNGIFSQHRIVSVGARMRAVTGTAATGEITVAVHPLKGLAPPLSRNVPGVVDPGGTTRSNGSYVTSAGPRSTLENYLDGLGLPFTGIENNARLDGSKLVNMPAHSVASLAECAARGLHIRAVPFEGAARDFKRTGYRALGTDSLDVGLTTVTVPSPFSQQYGVDMSPWVVGGHESMAISVNGSPNINLVTLEVIYHVEAIPNPAYSLLARPTTAIPRLISSATLDNDLVQLQRLPRVSFADMVTQVGDAMLGDVEGRIGSAGAAGLSSLSGMLGRLLAAGT